MVQADIWQKVNSHDTPTVSTGVKRKFRTVNKQQHFHPHEPGPHLLLQGKSKRIRPSLSDTGRTNRLAAIGTTLSNHFRW